MLSAEIRYAAERKIQKMNDIQIRDAVQNIIYSKGGNRCKDIIKSGCTIERTETWNDEHKIVEVTAADGSGNACEIDIVTETITG